MNFGSIIKYYRLRNGLTQAELSEGICSVSHLSKIESNKYSPHKETLEELFKRMNIALENEIHVYQNFEKKLSEFIGYAIYYDFESMERLYMELQKDEGYLQSTDLLNKYELYKLRYYLFKKEMSQAKRQLQMIDKLTPTFNASEQIISVVFSIMFYISAGDNNQAEKLLSKIDEYAGIKSISNILGGEYFYQRAWLLQKKAHYDKSSYYADFAINHFRKDFNYIRLMHAQMLQAINFTNLGHYLWAEELFSILMRNTRMMRQEELYHQTLYNFSILQKRMGNHANAYDLLVQLKSIISTECEFYNSVLLNMLHTSIGTNRESPQTLEELQERANKSDEQYLKIQLSYFKNMKLTHQELYDYCEEIMFPFLSRFDDIREGRRMALRLAKYHKDKGNYEKAYFYNNYFNKEGDENHETES
jgi:HTH-type transcriptional regulator, quorum sensing regulator NprR